jgi:hypothetical protein
MNLSELTAVCGGSLRRRLPAGRLSGLAVTVRTVLFNHFVVHTHDKECRGPLADEQSPVVLAHDLENRRPGHCAEGGAKVTGGGNSGGLGFNPGRELVFTLPGYVRSSGKWHSAKYSLYVFLSCGPSL